MPFSCFVTPGAGSGNNANILQTSARILPLLAVLSCISREGSPWFEHSSEPREVFFSPASSSCFFSPAARSSDIANSQRHTVWILPFCWVLSCIFARMVKLVRASAALAKFWSSFRQIILHRFVHISSDQFWNLSRFDELCGGQLDFCRFLMLSVSSSVHQTSYY